MISAVSERSERGAALSPGGAATAVSSASTARTIRPSTSPPNEPRPCCQPSGTSLSKAPGPVRRGVST